MENERARQCLNNTIEVYRDMVARFEAMFPGCQSAKRFDVDVYETAVAALEKQIPKRAVGTHYAHMRCPSCNRRIPSGGGSSSRRRDNWCNYCGQKIDWTKGEEDATAD